MPIPASLSKLKSLFPVFVVGASVAITIKLLTESTPLTSEILQVKAEEDILSPEYKDELVELKEPEPEPEPQQEPEDQKDTQTSEEDKDNQENQSPETPPEQESSSEKKEEKDDTKKDEKKDEKKPSGGRMFGNSSTAQLLKKILGGGGQK